ncbi:MAG TPA: transglutaminase-like domain-containing protein [Candidatus Baltobacteraceae bacterium]|jgi:hypothetical protein
MASESGSLHVNPLASPSSDFYRSADESSIHDFLCIAGWAEQYRREPQAARAAAAGALERWISAGLPFRKHHSVRTFDPAEVVNFAKALGMRGDDDFWEQHYVATGRWLVGELAAPRTVAPDESRCFSLRLERTVNLGHYAAGDRVRLHLPLPIEDESMHDVHVVPDVDGATRIESARIESGRLVATVIVPQEKIASIAAEIAFCHPERSERSERSRRTATISDLELYLRPQEQLIKITPRMLELAKRLGVNKNDSLATMRSIWDFFFEHLALGVVHYDALGENPLDFAIESGLFDCRLGSALIVALCRAGGIPARICSGYALYAVPYYHHWAEVWTDDRGWLPFDLICWDLSLRGEDATWTGRFFARIDARMTTERLPRTFTGFPSVQFPDAWHVLSRPIQNGAAFGLFSVETGALVYEDRLALKTNA